MFLLGKENNAYLFLEFFTKDLETKFRIKKETAFNLLFKKL